MRFVTHDVFCFHGHGFMEDELFPANHKKGNYVICPQCVLGDNPDPFRQDIHLAKIVWQGTSAAVHGIVWDNKQHSKQLGVTFETNKQKRDYLKKHGINEFSKGDADDRRIGTRAREDADKLARTLGYSDNDHRRKTEAAEKAKGWNPKDKSTGLYSNVAK